MLSSANLWRNLVAGNRNDRKSGRRRAIHSFIMAGDDLNPAADHGKEAPVGEGGWKATLQPESRQRIVDKLMETLKQHLPCSGAKGLQALKNIAEQFEETVYSDATSQSDYLRKISLKMIAMVGNSQNSMPNSLLSNSADTGDKPTDLCEEAAADWRAVLTPQSRERITCKIMETLTRNLPCSGQDALQELKKIAGRFEEKIYNVATSLSDYLHKISLKMLTMESKSKNSIPNNFPSNSAGTGGKPPDPGALPNIQPLQSLPILLPANQPQVQQKLLSQNLQSTITSTGSQTSASSPSSLPPISGTNHTPINVVGQSANSMPGVVQNPAGSTSTALGVPSNMFGNAQLLMLLQQQLIHIQDQLQQLQQQLLMHSQLQRHMQPQASTMQMTQLQPPTWSNLYVNHQLPQMMRLPGTHSGNSRMQSSLFGKDQQQSIPQSNFSILQQLILQQQPVGTMSAIPSTQSNLSASLDSMAQTGPANGGDWQEEAYQKIQTMKEMYLPELNEMYKKFDWKLQHHNDSTVLKAQVESLMSFLKVSKNNVLRGYKMWIDSYDKQIIALLNEHRPSKRMRQQLPSSEMQMSPPLHQIDDVNEVKPDISSLSNAGDVASTVQEVQNLGQLKRLV
ncbi:unnamed protein product [Linum trigynum]|uniref:Mediator complex subunit 15 KIX domain-containing protein n=1 Tax=Linum trigynum TaxID=586398 RepID=A0AAV2GE04_9ROSI